MRGVGECEDVRGVQRRRDVGCASWVPRARATPGPGLSSRAPVRGRVASGVALGMIGWGDGMCDKGNGMCDESTDVGLPGTDKP